MELKLSQPHLPASSTSLFVAISIHKHFPILAVRWKCQVQELSAKGRRQFKKISVHVVKEGENLSTISKLYGVPIDEIAAANRDILDDDLILQGKHLNIPSSPGECTRMYPAAKITLPVAGRNLSGTRQHLEFYSRHLNQKMLSMLSLHHLPYAKTTGCFLVLVPLLAFCIRCVMDAFLNRNVGDGKLQAMNEPNIDNHGSKSRWKLALSDLRDPDAPDTDHSRQDIDLFSDNEEHFQSEKISQAYTKLEIDYQKFLSECGISKSGYWRGGLPE
ncbi:uncharacterized protein LOC116016544 isoform X2 [Ipomoea triloba]|uniref:uncharacterized protein LOC116016544 isoform X2 n=1 Tax=Ipomoea triloba TaxID=35885 RepID=UPI00125DEFF3|nr:uncharacterized protein LOC116016544 isoform X2 [Ipomoea triloba]